MESPNQLWVITLSAFGADVKKRESESAFPAQGIHNEENRGISGDGTTEPSHTGSEIHLDSGQSCYKPFLFPVLVFAKVQGLSPHTTLQRLPLRPVQRTEPGFGMFV